MLDDPVDGVDGDRAIPDQYLAGCGLCVWRILHLKGLMFRDLPCGLVFRHGAVPSGCKPAGLIGPALCTPHSAEPRGLRAVFAVCRSNDTLRANGGAGRPRAVVWRRGGTARPCHNGGQRDAVAHLLQVRIPGYSLVILIRRVEAMPCSGEWLLHAIAVKNSITAHLIDARRFPSSRR